MVLGKPRLTLVMIVRDEAGRVGRALASVRGVADRWLIVDTGSADATVSEIGSATVGWPGSLVHRPWLSFGENRTELLRLARESRDADWLLTIDADHSVEEAALIPDLISKTAADAIQLPFASEPLLWTMRLLRADKPWVYRGTTREYLDCDEPFIRQKLNAPRIRDHADGASRTDKWRRDADMLRAELAENPDDARRWFYLAES
jgi:glycosyltransferase involved in cell wall biosynthesis